MNRAEAEKLIQQAEIRVESFGIGSGRRYFLGSINDLMRLIELAALEGRKECTQLCDAVADDAAIDYADRRCARVLADDMKALPNSLGEPVIPDDEPIRRK